jgi:hypothetical protein
MVIMNMQNLEKLLSIPNSQISQVLKLSLHGLEATLKQANLEYQNDPGNEICEQLISEIQQLLNPAPVPEPTPIITPEISTINKSQSSELQLAKLKKIFETDLELRFYLGYAPLKSQNDADLWREIHRQLLRVPEDLATVWKKRCLEIAQKAGATEDKINLEHFPFIRDEVIYPGLNGTVQAKGLCLSKRDFFKSEIAENYQSEESQLLAGFLLLYQKFIEIEPNLHHALKSVFSFDVVSLSSQPEQKQMYLDALRDRLQRTQKAIENTDPLLILRAWLDIDEAIHSLVFLPPSERYSWWGKLQQESRRILKKIANQAIQSGNEIKIKQLSGLYSDIFTYTKDDLQLDHGGTPGEVLACLRLYAKIGEDEIPGRVIFRSLR